MLPKFSLRSICLKETWVSDSWISKIRTQIEPWQGEADYTAYGFLHWGVKHLYHLKEQQVIQQRLTAGNAKIMLKKKSKNAMAWLDSKFLFWQLWWYIFRFSLYEILILICIIIYWIICMIRICFNINFINDFKPLGHDFVTEYILLQSSHLKTHFLLICCNWKLDITLLHWISVF